MVDPGRLSVPELDLLALRIGVIATLQVALFLTGVPGLRESIVEGLRTPLEHCEKELDW